MARPSKAIDMQAHAPPAHKGDFSKALGGSVTRPHTEHGIQKVPPPAHGVPKHHSHPFKGTPHRGTSYLGGGKK